MGESLTIRSCLLSHSALKYQARALNNPACSGRLSDYQSIPSINPATGPSSVQISDLSPVVASLLLLFLSDIVRLSSSLCDYSCRIIAIIIRDPLDWGVRLFLSLGRRALGLASSTIIPTSPQPAFLACCPLPASHITLTACSGKVPRSTYHGPPGLQLHQLSVTCRSDRRPPTSLRQ